MDLLPHVFGLNKISQFLMRPVQGQFDLSNWYDITYKLFLVLI